MYIGNVPEWYHLSVERQKDQYGKGRYWLYIRIYPHGMKWLREGNLSTTSYMLEDPHLGPFVHLQDCGAWLPFGYQGIGFVRTMEGGARIKLPLMPQEGEANLVCATLSTLSLVLGTEPEERVIEAFWKQMMLVRFTYNDRPQGRNIVGCLSPEALKRIRKSGRWWSNLGLRRATRIARDIWNGPRETKLVTKDPFQDDNGRDFFDDNPIQLKENWFVISCPGNATGLATRQTYNHDPRDSLLFSGCNIDSPVQQLCLFGAFVALLSSI